MLKYFRTRQIYSCNNTFFDYIISFIILIIYK